MPRSLADGKIKLSIMSVKPASMDGATLTELNAGIDAACSILASNFKLGPTGSDKQAEKSLCTAGNANSLGASNAEGEITIFRYFGTNGQAEVSGAGTIGDAAFQAVKTKGTTVWIAKRFTSKASTDPWAAGDEVQVYECLTDNPVDGEATGYIKKTIPLEVQDFILDGTAVAP